MRRWLALSIAVFALLQPAMALAQSSDPRMPVPPGPGRSEQGSGTQPQGAEPAPEAEPAPAEPEPAPQNTDGNATDQESTEAGALDAVQSGDAVALDSLLPDVRRRTGGEIIDAQLTRIDGELVYAVRVLTPDGNVQTEYYMARTGAHMDGP